MLWYRKGIKEDLGGRLFFALKPKATLSVISVSIPHMLGYIKFVLGPVWNGADGTISIDAIQIQCATEPSAWTYPLIVLGR